MTRALAIPEPERADIAQIPALARQIEKWAETVDDTDALEEARARVAAIETYLRRRHEGAAAEIARAARKLDFRVAELLPTPKVGRPRSRETSHACDVSGVPKDDRYRLRQMHAHRDEPAVIDAVERGASQREVLRAIDRVKADKVVNDTKKWIDENIPAPTDPDGDRFRAKVWESIFAVEDAATAIAKWSVDDVRRAIATEKHKHVREQMAGGLINSINTLNNYRKAVS